ncbi:MAG: hypothetical protein ABEJ66_01025, partial [Candidatus Nanohaloarchaea archaeon]
FDTRSDKFPDIQEKLQKIARVTDFKLENQGIEDLLLSDEQVGAIASRSSEVWVEGILAYIKDQSFAWAAAQEVHLCASGNEGVCQTIENRIAGEPTRGFYKWYLLKAYEWRLQQVFEPGEFFERYYQLFKPGEGIREAQKRRQREGLAPITEDQYPELDIPDLNDTVAEGVDLSEERESVEEEVLEERETGEEEEDAPRELEGAEEQEDEERDLITEEEEEEEEEETFSLHERF